MFLTLNDRGKTLNQLWQLLDSANQIFMLGNLTAQVLINFSQLLCEFTKTLVEFFY